MNYLAHLHLADSVSSHLAANLLADFVRGKPDNRFPNTIVQGIYLHRFVDKTADQSPEVQHAKRLFPMALRRFSGIALDICWDHYLIRHWQSYHSESFDTFMAYAETEVLSYPAPSDYNDFHLLQQRMWQGGWIQSYQQKEGIVLAIKRVAQRRARLAPLRECGDTFLAHYDELNSLFLTLYPTLIAQVNEFSSGKHASTL